MTFILSISRASGRSYIREMICETSYLHGQVCLPLREPPQYEVDLPGILRLLQQAFLDVLEDLRLGQVAHLVHVRVGLLLRGCFSLKVLRNTHILVPAQIYK
jgi:hypothetical protein